MDKKASKRSIIHFNVKATFLKNEVVTFSKFAATTLYGVKFNQKRMRRFSIM